MQDICSQRHISQTSCKLIELSPPGVVGDSFLDIEPLPDLHVFPLGQPVHPIQPDPPPPQSPHPTVLKPKPLAATKASSRGRETPSQCFSSTKSSKGDKSSAEEQAKPKHPEGSRHVVCYEREEPCGEERPVHREWRIVQGWLLHIL